MHCANFTAWSPAAGELSAVEGSLLSPQPAATSTSASAATARQIVVFPEKVFVMPPTLPRSVLHGRERPR